MLIAFAALVVGFLGFAKAITMSMSASETSLEATRAREAARQKIESLSAEDFSQLFVLYNDDPTDDPGGAGSAPGKNFAVQGLDLADGDPDGLAGEILLPYDAANPGVLLESLVDKRLGMPRDLNGDLALDWLDHSSDYALLPIVVRVEWRGAAGTGRVELRTMLADLQ